VIGVYHHLSEPHINRYLAEFDFRYSTRDISDRERADLSLKGISGKRLTFGGLIASPPDCATMLRDHRHESAPIGCVGGTVDRPRRRVSTAACGH